MPDAWKKRAACRGHIEEVPWDDPRQPASALFVGRYCKHCPVKAECLELGMTLLPLPDNRVLPDGVWGGLSLNQRKRRYANRD